LPYKIQNTKPANPREVNQLKPEAHENPTNTSLIKPQIPKQPTQTPKTSLKPAQSDGARDLKATTKKQSEPVTKNQSELEWWRVEEG
jgi:hypothetical protein